MAQVEIRATSLAVSCYGDECIIFVKITVGHS